MSHCPGEVDKCEYVFSNYAQIVKSKGFKFKFFGLFLLTYGGLLSTVVFVLKGVSFTVPRMVLLEKDEGVYISGSEKGA